MAAAFDALRFDRDHTLDLRSSLPTGAEAARRAELFLRERQITSDRDVLVITGRGNQSADGVPVVRPTVLSLLAALRRRGVVAGWQEHTPGSFVVTPAPISALLERPRRHGDDPLPAPVGTEVLAGIETATQVVLRRLAERSLEALGAPGGESFVQDEMRRQFSVLGASISAGPHREAQLRAAAERALDELDAAT